MSPPRKTLRNSILIACGLAAILCIASVVFVWTLAHGAGQDLRQPRPNEGVRYLLRRLEGHNKIETVLRPPLPALQRQIERPVPNTGLPNLGKGQRARPLAEQQFDRSGRPVESSATPAAIHPAASRVLQLISIESLRQAMAAAKPGDVLELQPGHYVLKTRINTGTAGTPDAPITVRAAVPNTVDIASSGEIAFRVTQPYWIFENLNIRGVCGRHDDCEHAFQVVSRASATVLRNNFLTDFNAHIKVNGAGDHWPDDGLVQFNTLTNTSPRNTTHPVTPFDLVGANGWLVLDNLVTDFVKLDGNRVSFGLFMKGASQAGRIERNLVICTTRSISQPGVRVGISFGGGGTYPVSLCRLDKCKHEHAHGLAANNIIAHCNDSGIDVNRSRDISLAHNTLVNTAGIDARGGGATVLAYGNLMDGEYRARDHSAIKRQYDDFPPPRSFIPLVDGLAFTWSNTPERIPTWPGTNVDFCRQPRHGGSLPGALANVESAKQCEIQ